MSLNFQDFSTGYYCYIDMLTTTVVVKLSNMSGKTSFKHISALKSYSLFISSLRAFCVAKYSVKRDKTFYVFFLQRKSWLFYFPKFEVNIQM